MTFQFPLTSPLIFNKQEKTNYNTTKTNTTHNHVQKTVTKQNFALVYLCIPIFLSTFTKTRINHIQRNKNNK